MDQNYLWELTDKKKLKANGSRKEVSWNKKTHRHDCCDSAISSKHRAKCQRMLLNNPDLIRIKKPKKRYPYKRKEYPDDLSDLKDI